MNKKKHISMKLLKISDKKGANILWKIIISCGKVQKNDK